MKLTPEEIIIAVCMGCPFEGKFSDEDCHACQRNLNTAAKAQLAKVKQLYPIMYQEEADEVGKFLRRGWIPPAEAKARLDREGLREALDNLLSQYSSGLLAWKGWGMGASEKVHDLKIEIIKDIIALLPTKEEIRKDEGKRIKGLLIQAKSSMQDKYENQKLNKPNAKDNIEVLRAKLNSLQQAITIIDGSGMISETLKGEE